MGPSERRILGPGARRGWLAGGRGTRPYTDDIATGGASLGVEDCLQLIELNYK
jgi:hypothetical protein